MTDSEVFYNLERLSTMNLSAGLLSPEFCLLDSAFLPLFSR
jgi:hypothetical protein